MGEMTHPGLFPWLLQRSVRQGCQESVLRNQSAWLCHLEAVYLTFPYIIFPIYKMRPHLPQWHLDILHLKCMAYSKCSVNVHCHYGYTILLWRLVRHCNYFNTCLPVSAGAGERLGLDLAHLCIFHTVETDNNHHCRKFWMPPFSGPIHPLPGWIS